MIREGRVRFRSPLFWCSESGPFCALQANLETTVWSSCVVGITQGSVMGTKMFSLTSGRLWVRGHWYLCVHIFFADQFHVEFTMT